MNLSLSSPAVEQEKSQQGMNLLLLQQMYQPVLSGLFSSHYHTLQHVISWLAGAWAGLPENINTLLSMLQS